MLDVPRTLEPCAKPAKESRLQGRQSCVTCSHGIRRPHPASTGTRR
ncbi:MAG: hypothetical protein ACYCW6_10370 [Candidatus Xenobia bacterium]